MNSNNDLVLTIRFKNADDKAAFVKLAELLHTNTSNLGQEILVNHTKEALKQKDALDGYSVFFGKRV